MFKDTQSQNQHKRHMSFVLWKLLPYTIYAILLPVVLFRLYFDHLPLPRSLACRHPRSNSILVTSSLFSTPLVASPQGQVAEAGSTDEIKAETPTSPCDYTSGKWVHDESSPLYNETTCRWVSYGQNCITHGRPDSDYLYWRWKPHECYLPRFEPNIFLHLLRNKHVAFIGDSLARNQLESLICMLSSISDPILVYSSGDDKRFRRWAFPSHNVNISAYWSPFLVKGVERPSKGSGFNKMYLDSVDERWAADSSTLDMVVLSIGHWFLNPSLYLEDDSIIGCHLCSGLNHTEIGFYDAMRKVSRTALKALIERSKAKDEAIDVFLATFSPSHFEGDWDKFAACPRTKPYDEGEKLLEVMFEEIRDFEVEEVEAAKTDVKGFPGIRLLALDVTKLSWMRPDGHPGQYLHHPSAKKAMDRVFYDCVHWCLPGPIDTWNEILLEVIKRRNSGERR